MLSEKVSSQITWETRQRSVSVPDGFYGFLTVSCFNPDLSRSYIKVDVFGMNRSLTLEFSTCANMTPVIINCLNHIWQFHNR